MYRSYAENSSRLKVRLDAARLGLPVLLVLVSLTSAGCFNAEAMIESRRLVATRARLEEVDLGEFRVTLPHAVQKTDSSELRFQVFGQVANRDLHNVEEMLKQHGPEVRHNILIVARQMSVEDLEDPKLTALRSRIAQVVNESLEDNPVQSVGFYRFRYIEF